MTDRAAIKAALAEGKTFFVTDNKGRHIGSVCGVLAVPTASFVPVPEVRYRLMPLAYNSRGTEVTVRPIAAAVDEEKYKMRTALVREKERKGVKTWGCSVLEERLQLKGAFSEEDAQRQLHILENLSKEEIVRLREVFEVEERTAAQARSMSKDQADYLDYLEEYNSKG